MPNTKEISSLGEGAGAGFLTEAEPGLPVYLAQNGNRKYAVVDIEEYKLLRQNAMDNFFAEIEPGGDDA